MDKFENSYVFLKTGSNAIEVCKLLNQKGQEGWEVSGVLKNNQSEIIFFLKRKLYNEKRKKG